IRRNLDTEENLQQELARLTPEQQERFASRPEGKEHSQRYRAARGVFSPVSRALAALLGRLSPQQWTVLRQAGQMTLSTEPQPGYPPQAGEMRLPEEIGRLLRAAQPGIYRPMIPGVARDPGIEEDRKSGV